MYTTAKTNQISSYIFKPKASPKWQLFDLSFICPEEPADYKNRGDLESDMGVRKACRFSRTVLGPCSGLTDREFGFKEGKPCVIVKLNRIVNFRPRVNVINFRVVLPLPDVFILYSWPADIINFSYLSVCPRILPLFTFFFSLQALMTPFLKMLNIRSSPMSSLSSAPTRYHCALKTI